MMQPAGSLHAVVGTQRGMEKVGEYRWDAMGMVLLAHCQRSLEIVGVQFEWAGG